MRYGKICPANPLRPTPTGADRHRPLRAINALLIFAAPSFRHGVQAAGADPIHFGRVMITAATLGSMTPPVGVAMSAVCGIMKCAMREYTREAIPFISAAIAPILLMILWPASPVFTGAPDLPIRQSSVYAGFRLSCPQPHCLRALPTGLPANARWTRAVEATRLKCPKDAGSRPTGHCAPLTGRLVPDHIFGAPPAARVKRHRLNNSRRPSK